MKLLIAYDGSESSDAAIVDLRRAGLPAVAEASVLSVAETSPALAAIPYGVLAAGPGMFFPDGLEGDISTSRSVQDAEGAAALAADRLRADFPGWHVSIEAWVDSAKSAIVRKAHAMNPDLIVVGSHGGSGIRRWALGSVSQYVLHHVSGSVRISRHRLHSQERSIRLVIGMDESQNAEAAVHAVATRNWPAETEIRVIGVLDSGIALAAAVTPEGAIPSEMEEESQRRLSGAVHEAVRTLTNVGVHASPQILAGKPSEVLLSEAEKWAADCIFVGARGLSGLERFLLGSVSTAVASHAHCSVEIVRSSAG